MKDTIILRTIRPEEGVQAARIEQACFPPNEACTEPNMISRAAEAPRLFLIAEDTETGEIIGFLNGLATDEESFRDEFFTDASLHNPAGERILILGLAILPEYRNQGIASALMKYYVQRERACGRKELVLTCLEAKVSMYQHMGYEDLGLSASSWGGERWHEMRYLL